MISGKLPTYPTRYVVNLDILSLRPILLIGLTTFCLLASGSLIAQDVFTHELVNLTDISRLAAYRDGKVEQFSSYDRTGDNDDGFSGKYSYIREERDGLVIAEMTGPGVVNRIWTPTPTADTIKFFFDGEKLPRIAVPFIHLFSGDEYPFLKPLCGNELGGYFCYLPIPYERSLKIVFTGKKMRFYQIQYRSLPSHTKVTTFTTAMLKNSDKEWGRLASVWKKTLTPLSAYKEETITTKQINLSIKAGQEATLFSLNRGGRIVGLELNTGSLLQEYRNVIFSARWDGAEQKAIDAPLHDFFGFTFGKPSMQSVFLGSNARHLYSYLPMPFDKSAALNLAYRTGRAGNQTLEVTGTIYYVEQPRDRETEGRLYVQSRRHHGIPSGVTHTIGDVRGKGHYVGTLLQTQGLEEGSTWYFEGDDKAVIDGELRLHGTGSEDYFNGGWYAVIDRWDRAMSLPIHGCLEYDLMTSRTGGYRFYLSDKLNFENSFQLSIEHQPDKKNNVHTDYTSLGFFYSEKPVFENTPIVIDKPVEQSPERHKLTPQGMVYSLYWLAQAKYEDPSIVFSLQKSDAWFATIDPEAVPIVQVSLDGLDKGKYKLFVEYSMEENSGPFSIWQRSSQVSDWLGATDKNLQSNTVYAGDITITDQLNTITLRKKSSDTTVRIFSFKFEKIE